MSSKRKWDIFIFLLSERYRRRPWLNLKIKILLFPYCVLFIYCLLIYDINQWNLICCTLPDIRRQQILLSWWAAAFTQKANGWVQSSPISFPKNSYKQTDVCTNIHICVMQIQSSAAWKISYYLRSNIILILWLDWFSLW